jgi:hypothetical protein
MIPVNPYSASMVALVSDAPTPRSSPAMGNSAMGSMNARPTRCKRLKKPPRLFDDRDVSVLTCVISVFLPFSPFGVFLLILPLTVAFYTPSA